MKVSELIQVLKGYPDDAIVRVLSVDDETETIEYFPITSSMPWRDDDGAEYIDL